jgi:hypothetical protein
MNCVGHIQHGMVDSSARSLNRVQHDPILAGFGAPGGTRQVRRNLPGRYRRSLRRLPRRPGPIDPRRRTDSGRRPNDGRTCHGSRHRTHRFRRHRQCDLLTAVSVRPPHVDSRPLDRRPGRLEHRDRLYHEHASIEGALAHFSSSTGLDFSRYELDEPIRYVKNDAINSAVETLTTLSAQPWTLRRVISGMGLGSRNPGVVGSVEEWPTI